MGILAVKLIDRDSKREDVGPFIIRASSDSGVDAQAAGCKTLCELLGINNHVGPGVKLYARADGDMMIQHNFFANLQELATLASQFPEEFKVEGSTLTVYYCLPDNSTPAADKASKPNKLPDKSTPATDKPSRTSKKRSSKRQGDLCPQQRSHPRRSAGQPLEGPRRL